MREVHALVAEAAVDFEHALEAAHEQALEVQLGCNAQVDFHVERVEMRGEGLGRRTARKCVQHGGLDLEIAVVHAVLAHGRDDLGTLDERLFDVVVHDEVDVALAIAQLFVGQAVELLGKRAQRLGEKRHLGCRNGELAAARAHDRARDADPIAHVKLLDAREGILADVVDADEELDEPGGVLETHEHDLALAANRHDAACDGDDVLGRLAVFELGVALLEVCRVVSVLEASAIGVFASVDQSLALVATDLNRVVDDFLVLLCHA